MSEQTRVILHHLPPMLFPCAKNPAEAAAVTMSTAPAGNPLMLSPVVIFGRDRTPPRTSSPLFVEVSARPSVRASSCRHSTFSHCVGFPRQGIGYPLPKRGKPKKGLKV